MYFYDTCALINDQEVAFNEPFVIADITLYELEDIKTSRTKDEELKIKVRKLLHRLKENPESYKIIQHAQDCLLQSYQDRNDMKIILTALVYSEEVEPIEFRTDDLACAFLARNNGLKVVDTVAEEEEYTGFKTLEFQTEDETQEFYSHMTEGNLYGLLPNQYLFIYVKGECIDKLKWNGEIYEQVGFPCFESKALGKIKPKDEFQMAAMDSLKNNQLTVLRGPAGTGKSCLALGYLMDRLEHGVIDKIIIFCNTVATIGAAKLGLIIG